MSESDKDKLQRLLDYHLKLDEPAERLETQRLLVEDGELRWLQEALEGMLRPLASWAEEAPPQDLAGRTLERIGRHVGAARATRGEARQDRRGAGAQARWVLGNLRDLAAVAASVLLIVSAFRPALWRMRQTAQEQACALQMHQAGLGMAQYAQDYAGVLPYVPRPAGAKWWYAGGAAGEGGSNTRNLFLLVKGGYAPAQVFVCPGTQGGAVRVRIRLDPQVLEAMQDFASRAQVSYSLRLRKGGPPLRGSEGGTVPVLSDQNPLFAGFDAHGQRELNVASHPDLLQGNSPNHAGLGQNLLYGDGAVRFSPQRWVGPGQDDIFTIQSETGGALGVYRGNELPRSDDDSFIAP